MLLPVIIIFLISLFTLFGTFSLNLLGDDWLAFFRYFQHLGPKSSGSWNHLTYFLTPYGAQDIMMGFLQKLIGYQSSGYYFTSFILRMLAAFSLYPLTVYLTKSRLAASFAVLFFSVSVVGFDTTNWSSNMTTYITITLFNLFLYYFLKSREMDHIKFFSFAVILYYLAYVTTPIRMHGSLVFIFLLEAFWVFQNRKLKFLKISALRFSVILIIFFIIRFTGQSQGPAQEAMERLTLGITQNLEMLSQGRFDFMTYPIIIFGGMFIPDFLLPFTQPISNLSQLFLKLILPSLSGFLILTFFIIKNIQIPTRSLKLVIFAELTWSIIVAITYKTNSATFSDSKMIFLSLIGGYVLILGIILLFYFFKQRTISTAIFLAISWAILSFFFAWWWVPNSINSGDYKYMTLSLGEVSRWWVPNSIFPTTYRYLVVSLVGVSILFATIIGLGKEKKQKVTLFTILCVILALHMVATHIYIGSLLASHGQQISNKIWSSIPRISEIGKSREPIIFYFEGDGSNQVILHNVITFGFPPHMALLYDLREEDGGIPIPMDNFGQVVSAATDGKALKAYGYPIKPVPIERIYAFHLEGQDNLIDITQEAREKIKELTKNLIP